MKIIKLQARMEDTTIGTAIDGLGGCTPSYISHTRAFWDLFIEGVIYIEKMIIR